MRTHRSPYSWFGRKLFSVVICIVVHVLHLTYLLVVTQVLPGQCSYRTPSKSYSTIRAHTSPAPQFHFTKVIADYTVLRHSKFHVGLCDNQKSRLPSRALWLAKNSCDHATGNFLLTLGSDTKYPFQYQVRLILVAHAVCTADPSTAGRTSQSVGNDGGWTTRLDHGVDRPMIAWRSVDCVRAHIHEAPMYVTGVDRRPPVRRPEKSIVNSLSPDKLTSSLNLVIL